MKIDFDWQCQKLALEFVENSLEDNFWKNLPTAAALSLPSTIFLPYAPAQKFCPIFPLKEKIQKLQKKA